MHLLKHFMYDKHTQTYLIFISHLTATCTKTTKTKMFNLLKTIKNTGTKNGCNVDVKDNNNTNRIKAEMNNKKTHALFNLVYTNI